MYIYMYICMYIYIYVYCPLFFSPSRSFPFRLDHNAGMYGDLFVTA